MVKGDTGMSKPPDFDRRRFVGVAAATVAAGPLGLLGRVNAMTHALTDVAQPTGSGGADIRPFRFKASDADLTDLRRRINATKCPSGNGCRIHRTACRSPRCNTSRVTGELNTTGRSARQN